MFRFPRIPALAIVPALFCLSCVGFLGPQELRRELGRTAGVQLDREFGLTVRRSGIWLARLGMRMANEDEIPLDGVRRVQVGVYRVAGLRKEVEERRRIEAEDFVAWEPLVRIHEGDEDVLVLTRGTEERIRGMLVVVAEEDEWVLVQIEGKLERLLEQTVEYAFDQADRPDLYGKSREQRGLDPPSPQTDEPAEVAGVAYP